MMNFFKKKPAAHIDVSQPDNVLTSPLKGTVVAMEDVPDETFASGVLGDGIAINPSEGALYAPMDGEITTLFETLHAICITSTNGAELLLHVGKDTVELNGKGFTAHVKNGQTVKRGDLLVTFDIKVIEKAGYPIITPICVSNSDEYELVKSGSGNVEVGDVLITLNKK